MNSPRQDTKKRGRASPFLSPSIPAAAAVASTPINPDCLLSAPPTSVHYVPQSSSPLRFSPTQLAAYQRRDRDRGGWRYRIGIATVFVVVSVLGAVLACKWNFSFSLTDLKCVLKSMAGKKIYMTIIASVLAILLTSFIYKRI